MKALLLALKKHYRITLCAVTLLVVVPLWPYLWAITLMTYVSMQSYPQGIPKTPGSSAVFRDDAQMLARIAPHRLGKILRYFPSDRIRAVACTALAEPDDFTEPIESRGVIPTLVETILHNPSGHIVRNAEQALTAQVAQKDEETEIVAMVAESISTRTVPAYVESYMPLLGYVLDCYPDSRPLLKERIVALADRDELKMRTIAIRLLGTYFPEDKRSAEIALRLIAGKSHPQDLHGAISGILAKQPTAFTHLLEAEPQSVSMLLRAILAARGPLLRRTPEILELTTLANDRAALAITNNETYLIHSSVHFLLRSDPDRVFTMLATLEPAIRSEVLKHFEVHFTRESEVLHRNSRLLTELFFLDDLPIADRVILAHCLHSIMRGNPPAEGLRAEKYHAEFRKLLTSREPKLEELASKYFYYSKELELEDIEAFTELVRNREGISVFGVAERIFQKFPDAPHSLELAKTINEFSKELYLPSVAFLFLLEKCPDQGKELLDEYWNKSQSHDRIFVVHRILAAEGTTLLSRPYVIEKIESAMLAEGTSQLLIASDPEIEKLEAVFGSERVYETLVNLIRQRLSDIATGGQAGMVGRPTRKCDVLERAVYTVIGEFLEEPDPRLARVAAFTLGEWKPARPGKEDLLLLGLSYPDNATVTECLQAARKFQTVDPKVLEQIRLLAMGAKNSEVRSIATTAWHELAPDDPKLAGALAKMKEEEVVGIRQNAERILRDLKD